MRLAVLSGKGGTGKTFVSTNLAALQRGSVYVDCDVEEPNGRLFLRCAAPAEEAVSVLLPTFDANKCTACRACVNFCQFNALAFVGKAPRVFSEVCHSCGGCRLVCNSGAIEEIPLPVGRIEIGEAKGVTVISGELNIGEASGVPVIRRALKEALSRNAPMTVIDCPPGSACSVTESISCADYCLMVAEPTAFGLHNLGMVIELARAVGKPCGVVINKSDGEYPPLDALCREHGIPILARIPYTRELASCISSGRLAAEEFDEVKQIFSALAEQIGGMI